MKKKAYWITLTVLAACTLLFNLLAFSKSFCDFYAEKISPILKDPIARVTDKMPFLLGELLACLGILILIAAVVMLPVLIIFGKHSRVRKKAVTFYKTLLMIVVLVLFDYTFSWSIPIRGSLLGKDISPTVDMEYEDIRVIRNYIVDELNKTAWEVPRDDDDSLIFPDRDEMNRGVIRGMQSLSGEYPRLKGFYPRCKNALCSDFLDWMNIDGFTMPYTAEIAVNKYSMAQRLYAPVLYAHESAHHKGFFKESEADFLSYIGCLGSDNALVRYSGLIYAYFEIEDAYSDAIDSLDAEDLDAIRGDMTDEEWLAFLMSYVDPEVDEIIYADLSGEYKRQQEAYEQEDHPFDIFEDAAEEVSEVGWDAQEQILGVHNYDGSTALLLQYFADKLL